MRRISAEVAIAYRVERGGKLRCRSRGQWVKEFVGGATSVCLMDHFTGNLKPTDSGENMEEFPLFRSKTEDRIRSCFMTVSLPRSDRFKFELPTFQAYSMYSKRVFNARIRLIVTCSAEAIGGRQCYKKLGYEVDMPQQPASSYAFSPDHRTNVLQTILTCLLRSSRCRCNSCACSRNQMVLDTKLRWLSGP